MKSLYTRSSRQSKNLSARGIFPSSLMPVYRVRIMVCPCESVTDFEEQYKICSIFACTVVPQQVLTMGICFDVSVSHKRHVITGSDRSHAHIFKFPLTPTGSSTRLECR